MKIIKHGNLNKGDKEFTCSRCGCIFVANHNEIQIRSIKGVHSYLCICPECGMGVTERIY